MPTLEKMPTKELLEQLKDKTFTELSYLLKLDYGTVSRLYKKYGIVKPELRGRIRVPMPPIEDLVKNKDKTLAELAELYETDPTTVGRWYKKCKIERPSLQGRHLKLDKEIPSKEELSQYSTKTYKEIAEIYKVSSMDVCNWFKKHKMGRRPWLSKSRSKPTFEKEVVQVKEVVKVIEATSDEKLKLDLIDKILTASDDFILAIHTLLGRN